MPDEPILDPQAIENLRSLSPDDGQAFLCELIGIYLQDTPGYVATIERALATQDTAALTRAAHTIKGSSSNFGATRLARVAQQVEAAAKAGDLAAATAGSGQLKIEYDLVRAELNRLAAAP